jgi:hypothetical protein
MDVKHAPGHRVYSLGEDGPAFFFGDGDQPPLFDNLSLTACGVLLVSGSVLLYALVPALGFDEGRSVASHLLGGRRSEAGAALWDAFEAIRMALQ